MARTKQTARKSTGGKAPRKQLATKGARSFRRFMTSQQVLGNAVVNTGSSTCTSHENQEKTSFINYENTLGSFLFYPSLLPTSSDFNPRFNCASTIDSRTGSIEHWLGISFQSKYDGGGMIMHQRPCVSLAVVLDVSGSMAWQFSDEGQFVSKLNVAKRCIKSILNQLTNQDSFAVILFNHQHQTLLPLQNVGKINKKKFFASLENVRSSGGTDLSGGFEAGTHLFKKKQRKQNSNNRIMFLTDMESSLQDEEKVLHLTKTCALNGTCFTSVVGIGVDLSVGTVQSLSCTRGAKYASCIHAKEFEKTIGAEFSHDVTPIAFDIQIRTTDPRVSFSKGYGSPEVNNLEKNKCINLSSEFPSVCDENGGIQGGLILIKLDFEKSGNTQRSTKGKGKRSGENCIKIETQWESVNKKTVQQTHIVKIPDIESSKESFFQDKNIRKAIALVRYVDLQSEYILDDTCNETSDSKNEKMPLHQQRELHLNYVEKFSNFIDWFKKEMSAVGDNSIYSTNANILQTLEQIVELELKELSDLDRKEASNLKLSANIDQLDFAGAPTEYMCPITRTIMNDPVVASDGHTYERKAIEEWFDKHTSSQVPSPLTMKLLPSPVLIPNIAIRKMISDFKEQQKEKGVSDNRKTATTEKSSRSQVKKMDKQPAKKIQKRGSEEMKKNPNQRYNLRKRPKSLPDGSSKNKPL